MVNLYRYSTRLAVFYEARGDAIDLLVFFEGDLPKHLDLTMDQIAAAPSLDSVDFGKPPAPPTQQVVELVRDAAKPARTGSAG